MDALSGAVAAPLQRQAVAVANETPDGQERQYRNRPRPRKWDVMHPVPAAVAKI